MFSKGSGLLSRFLLVFRALITRKMTTLSETSSVVLGTLACNDRECAQYPLHSLKTIVFVKF